MTPSEKLEQEAAFLKLGHEVDVAVQRRLRAKLGSPPRDPRVVFAQIASYIELGAAEAAMETFFNDVEARTRWNLMRGRLIEEEYSRADGRAGGRSTAKGNKLAGSEVTPTQKRRADDYRRLSPLKGEDTLRLMAQKEGVSENAVRQSLKAAGIEVSTANRRGRR